MIEAPSTNTTPPPPSVRHRFGFIYVPSMWAMGSLITRRRVREQAERDLNAETVLLPACWPSHYIPQFMLDDFSQCASCVGCIVFRDLMQPIPHGAAQMIDFFFGRDKREALVYEWRPWEKDFQMVDRDWLLARRAPLPKPGVRSLSNHIELYEYKYEKI